MDMKLICILILIGICNVIFGYWLGWYGRVKKPDGIFHVNTTDPDKDVYRMEFHCPIALIPEKKVLIFKVQNDSAQEKPFA